MLWFLVENEVVNRHRLASHAGRRQDRSERHEARNARRIEFYRLAGRDKGLVDTFALHGHESMVHPRDRVVRVDHLGPLDGQQSFVEEAWRLSKHDGKILRGDDMSWVDSQSLLVALLGLRKLSGKLRINA